MWRKRPPEDARKARPDDDRVSLRLRVRAHSPGRRRCVSPMRAPDLQPILGYEGGPKDGLATVMIRPLPEYWRALAALNSGILLKDE